MPDTAEDAALLQALNNAIDDISPDLKVTGIVDFDKEARIRRVNLLEILAEENENVHPPPDDIVNDWCDPSRGFKTPARLPSPSLTIPAPFALRRSEQDIRDYFTSGGSKRPFGKMHAPMAPAELRAKFPAPTDDAFRTWFPGLRRTATEFVDPEETPRFRIIAWPNAGNAEDMYTNDSVVNGRLPTSPLLDWCRKNGAEMLAVQLPGRGGRMRESFAESPQDAARALLPIVASRLVDVPYIVIGHSVGTWLAYEFVRMAQKEGLPAPVNAFLSNFPAPDVPAEERPWTPNRGLSDEKFKDECRAWDVNEAVFGPNMWRTYKTILRKDFELFDRYVHRHWDAKAEGGKVPEPFHFPITTFYGLQDKQCDEFKVRQWRFFTKAKFEIIEVCGNHLFPLDKDCKAVWLMWIVDRLADFSVVKPQAADPSAKDRNAIIE